MDSFSVAKQKLEMLWNLAQFQNATLQNPAELKKYILQHDLIEPVFTLHDSGWQIFSTTDAAGADNVAQTRRGTNLPTILKRYAFEYDILLDIPDLYLPFIDIQVKAKSIDGTEILGMEPYLRPDFFKYETITLAGNTIYTGIAHAPTQLYTQTDIDNGTIADEDHLKNVWSINGNNRRVKKVVITYDVQTSNTPCEAHTDFKQLIISYHESDKHNITNMTSTTVSGIGDIIQHTWTFNGSICVENTTRTTDRSSVSKNFNDGDVDSFLVQTETSTGANSQTFSTTASMTSVSQIGFWLYWGANKYPPRVGFKTVSGDDTIDLNSPINSPIQGGDTPGPVDIGQIVATPSVIETVSTADFSDFVGFKDIGILKLTNNDFIANSYRINLSSRLILKSKWEKTGQTNFLSTQKINTWTWNGSNYSEVLSTPTPYLIDTIGFPVQDVQYKIVVTFKNPFYYRKQTNLKT